MITLTIKSATVFLRERILCELQTIGEYTGLKDMFDKKIFEGDIVEYTTDDIYLITWEKTEALFGLKQDNDIYDFNSFWGSDLEVIGNIHSNPELIGRCKNLNN